MPGTAATLFQETQAPVQVKSARIVLIHLQPYISLLLLMQVFDGMLR
jgi:hypothetical protein